MKLVCAWCAETLASGEPGDPVSHGICPACAQLLREQRTRPMAEFLDQIEVPVVVFGSDLTTLYTNRAAARLSPAALEKTRGRPMGELIECPHARLPEGCGRTIHCSGCTILRMLADTQRDGIARQAFDVTKPVRRNGAPEIVRYCLSTQKVGESVLLIIEDRQALDSAALLGVEPQGP